MRSNEFRAHFNCQPEEGTAGTGQSWGRGARGLGAAGGGRRAASQDGRDGREGGLQRNVGRRPAGLAAGAGCAGASPGSVRACAQ